MQGVPSEADMLYGSQQPTSGGVSPNDMDAMAQQSAFDVDMHRFTGLPYASMYEVPQFKRGGSAKRGALSAMSRRAAR
jgi:hypothetical protein